MSHDRTNRTLQASLIALVALAVGALLAWAVWSGSDSEASAAPAGGQARLITFTGTGTAHVQPDGASISAGVSTKGASADAAQDAASRRMAALVKHLRGAGVAKQDLQTSDASVSEDYEHEGRFSANQSLTIRVRDVDRAGELLGEATQGGADSVSGPAFSLEDQRAGYDEALRTAIADARAKAEAAASHMDATVQSVYSIGEAGSGGGNPQPMFAAGAAMATDAKAVDVPTEQGTQDVTLTVEVSFTYDR